MSDGSGAIAPVAEAAAPLQLRNHEIGELLKTARRIGGDQHETIGAAVIHVVLHLIGNVGGCSDGNRHAHALGVDHGRLLHRHRRAAFGVDDRLEQALDSRHLDVLHDVIR